MKIFQASAKAVKPTFVRGLLADCLIALGCVALISWLRWAISPWVGVRLPYIVYFPFIAAMGWLRSARAAFLTVLASMVVGWLLFARVPGADLAPEVDDFISFGSFFVIGTSIAVLTALQSYERAKLKSLHESEQLQREWIEVTLKSIGDAVIATDPDGKIRFINGMAEKLTGWSLDEARERPLDEIFRIVNEDSRQTVESPLTKSLRSGHVVGLAHHTLLIARDGTEIPVADSAAPIFKADRTVAGMVLVFRSATDERERERLFAEADVARKQAETATRLKDDFLATVSHELRGPLNAIMGWAEALTRVSDQQSLLRGLHIIQDNVRTQARLIDDILDVSAMVADKFRLVLESVSPITILEESAESLRAEAEKKNIVLRNEIDPDTRLVQADVGRLRQAFNNIYANALKFTPAGGQISTRLIQHAHELEIAITDTGKGIGASFLPFLFDRFRQADPSIRRAEGGLGLGLAIVRSIVELHGGRIAAESRGEDQGTTIHIWIPSGTAIANAPAIQHASVIRSTVAPDRHSALDGADILIVDDDENIAEALSQVFERYGATVHVEHVAILALEAFDKKRPDAIVSDIGLPHRDGYWMMEKIREIEMTQGVSPVPAVAVTAYSRAEDRERSIRAGYQLHIDKPVSPDDVAAHVNRLIVAAKKAGATGTRDTAS